jgi:hypothetical protein
MKKDACEELKSFAVLDGTEWGEAMLALCHLNHYSYLLSPELKNSVEREIDEHLQYVKTHATVITETETHTSTYKSLEWND